MTAGATMVTADELLDTLRREVDHPATVRELMERLGWRANQRATLRRRLRALVERGDLIRIRGHRYGLPDRMHLVTGRVHVHPRGFGFVAPDHPVDGIASDVYIAGTNLNQAMHGDRVVVRVERRSDPGRAEGRILRIVERAAAQLVGRYEADGAGIGYVVPLDRRLPMDVQVPRDEQAGAQIGDLVVAELTRFPTATRGPLGRVIEVLGTLDTPGVDVRVVLRAHGIPEAHDPDAVAEAQGLGETLRSRDRKGRTDFRRLTTVTIDGETARDFDDAITLEPLAGGNARLGVHIADVSHYVADGSALDRSAAERGTSVYFPDRAVHMFPPELATGLCSLKPRVDRLVQSCVMEIDRAGEVVGYEIHDGIIHSNARMTYTDVDALLRDPASPAGQKYAGIAPFLVSLGALAAILTERRRRRGAIDFDVPVARFRRDDAGRVAAIVADERTTAHRIIEEFMLIANETVAEHLVRQGMPALFRVHERPDPAKVEAFEEFATSLGYSLAAPPDAIAPTHFQRLIERLRGKPEERPVARLMLRTMRLARYEPENHGHFGLAAASYTHFTSPIRRYPDLIVHRALRASRRPAQAVERMRRWSEALPEIARRTSELERRAEDAERELVHWQMVRFMADKVGGEFTGYVVGVTAFGLFVELVEQFVEGLVHVSSMADDYYRYVERHHLWQGENTGKVYRLGDRVRVRLVRVDTAHRQLDLALTDVLNAVRPSGPGSAARSRRPARSDRRRRGAGRKQRR
ncbi:MAG: ribonuclease R [Acidobacteria bacterium]|nr:ribonuclease R [Acidobacteriota bacterium]